MALRLMVKEPLSAVSVTVTVAGAVTLVADNVTPAPATRVQLDPAVSVKVAVGFEPRVPERVSVKVEVPDAAAVAVIAVVGTAVIAEIEYSDSTLTA